MYEDKLIPYYVYVCMSSGCNSHILQRRTSRGSSQPLPHWFSRIRSRPLTRRPKWSKFAATVEYRSSC